MRIKNLKETVTKQLKTFLDANKVLTMVQSGFRKGRSITTAMIKVIDYILLPQGNCEGTLLTDTWTFLGLSIGLCQYTVVQVTLLRLL